jgi:aldose 1-epimerase
MPFEIFKQQFGELTEYVVQDSSTENRFVVVPELGGIVRQLSIRKGLTLFSILKTPPTPDALKNDTESAGELLFPFASRIPEGKYKFLGKEYQLFKNEKNGMNAIHGLVRKQQFHLEEQIVHSDHAYIRLSHLIDSPEGYPFRVKFSIQYTLDTSGKFTLSFEAVNESLEPCPVMFGWHPYYRLGNEDVEAWKIIIPSNQLVTFDDNQIPTGVEHFHMDQPALLHRKVFDNCFVLNKESASATTELISENQDVTLSITQETGEGKFNHLVIYTPPERDCIAIEPLTANVNSFNTGDGLTILPQGGVFKGEVVVKLT